VWVIYTAFEEGRGKGVVGAEPADGRDAVCVANDLVGEVAGFGTEVVFSGGEDARVLIKRVLDDEETGAVAGEDAHGTPAAIEEMVKATFVMVMDD